MPKTEKSLDEQVARLLRWQEIDIEIPNCEGLTETFWYHYGDGMWLQECPAYSTDSTLAGELIDALIEKLKLTHTCGNDIWQNFTMAL